MKINQKELIDIATPKKSKTTKDLIVDFIKKHPNCKQSEILKFIQKDRRDIQRKINILISNGIIKKRTCECGNTNFYKLNK